MQIAETGAEGLVLAMPEGRLDTATAPEVEARLLALLARSGVLVDMAGVRFVSSAGLRLLLKAAKTAKATGRAFAVCGLQPPVREVFEVSGFDRIMRAFAGREEALAALR
jgi:anti-anti-sigma factor